LLTVFGFIAEPERHVFLKPECHARRGARVRVRFHVQVAGEPGNVRNLLNFARTVYRDTRDLRPRDMIDLQSFIWEQGSDEYAE
jgi:hypothetical protein